MSSKFGSLQLCFAKKHHSHSLNCCLRVECLASTRVCMGARFLRFVRSLSNLITLFVSPNICDTFTNNNYYCCLLRDIVYRNPQQGQGVPLLFAVHQQLSLHILLLHLLLLECHSYHHRSCLLLGSLLHH